MTEKERLIKFLSETINGFVTTKEITDAGFHRVILAQLVKDGILVRHSRGIYKMPYSDSDALYVLQTKYPKGIFAGETALYLHGYVKTLSEPYHMTFPNGYHAKTLKETPVRSKHCLNDLHEDGTMEIITNHGNNVKVYCIERVICDMIRGNSEDKTLVNSIIKKYISSDELDVSKLLYYADKIKVRKKIQKCLEILR